MSNPMLKNLTPHQRRLYDSFLKGTSNPLVAQERLDELRSRMTERKVRSHDERAAVIPAMASLNQIANPAPPKAAPPCPLEAQAQRHIRDGNPHLAERLQDQHGVDPECFADIEPPPGVQQRVQAAREAFDDRSFEKIREIAVYYAIDRTKARRIFEGEIDPPHAGPFSTARRGDPRWQSPREQLRRQVNREFQFDTDRPLDDE